MSHVPVRDFIYLDVERIRSFVAQAAGGLISELTTQAEHQVGGEGGGAAGLPVLGNVSGKADYHYLTSQMETKSLHDQIYQEFYERMKTRKRIDDMTRASVSDWNEGRFKDGAFVETRSILKLVDYQATLATMKAIPELDEAVKRFQQVGTSAASVPYVRGRQQSKPPARATIRSPFRSLPINDIGTVFDQFYKDLIRVKVFPFAGDATRIFVGSAHREAFRYQPTELVNIYGSVIDAGWTAILQVNKGMRHQPSSLLSQTGNQLEDGVEQMADFMSSLSEITRGLTFPAVAVTPIAIYREV